MLGKRTCASGNNKWAFPGSVINPEIEKSLFEAASERFAEETLLELFRVVQNGKPKVLKIKLPFFEWETYMYEVSPSWNIPETQISGFSEMKFVPVSELKNYELVRGVKRVARIFLRRRERERRKIRKIIEKTIQVHHELG